MTDWLVGGYGADMGGSARGIGRLRSRDDGTLGWAGLAVECDSPSYLLQRDSTLYAALEGRGRVAAIRDDAVVAETDAGGTWPCHLAVADGRLVVANYASGTLGMVSLDPFGLDQVVVPTPVTSPHPRQDGPHAHSSVEFRGMLISADLGADALHVHQGASRARSVRLPAGTGPRDLWVSPSGDLWVLGELSNRVLVLDGALEPIASVALPGALDDDLAACLVPSADGEHVLTALRGSDRVVALRTADLEPVAEASVLSSWPRHLAVDGPLVHVACERGDVISTLRFDGSSLVAVGLSDAVPSPTFLVRC